MEAVEGKDRSVGLLAVADGGDLAVDVRGNKAFGGGEEGWTGLSELEVEEVDDSDPGEDAVGEGDAAMFAIAD